jgi:hypothetical protein
VDAQAPPKRLAFDGQILVLATHCECVNKNPKILLDRNERVSYQGIVSCVSAARIGRIGSVAAPLAVDGGVSASKKPTWVGTGSAVEKKRGMIALEDFTQAPRPSIVPAISSRVSIPEQSRHGRSRTSPRVSGAGRPTREADRRGRRVRVCRHQHGSGIPRGGTHPSTAVGIYVFPTDPQDGGLTLLQVVPADNPSLVALVHTPAPVDVEFGSRA